MNIHCDALLFFFHIIANISSINGSLLSVSNDLSIQQIQVNCYTFRVEPNQVTWRIGSELIDSSYQPVTGSQLLDNVDQSYRHYITLNGSFSVGMSISCNTSVNGITSSVTYEFQGQCIIIRIIIINSLGVVNFLAPSQPPSALSATILSSCSLSISWMSVSGVDGYILYYNGGKAVLIEGQNMADYTLNGLNKGNEYNISIYSFSRLQSVSASNLSVNFNGKWFER